MKKTKIIFVLWIGGFLLNSCQYKEVKADAEMYCACKEREYAEATRPGECAKLLEKLKTKYEYLPEQQEILVLDIAECLSTE